MKKILSLLSLLMLCVVGANAETVRYALAEGDSFTSGQTVEVKNGDAVVATITYGESGGADFNAATADSHIDGFTAYTPGNGVNGNKTGGTFYTITPKVNATITVGVVLNADKAFYIEEDGVALEAYNGVTVGSKYYGTYDFEATANKAYKIYCAGSKLGFYGFEMAYTPAVPSKAVFLIPNAWDDPAANERYAAWAWAGGLGAWFDFVEYNGVFATAIPTYCTGITIVRMNGETTENNWEEGTKWNQTEDINFTEIADNTVFTMTSMDGAYITTPFSDLVAEAKAYMAIFDKNAAVALYPYFTALETELSKEVKDFDAIKAAIKELVNKADPFIKFGIQKVEGYAVDIDDEVLDNDIAIIKAAYEAKNFAALIASLKVYEQDFVGVAGRYLAKAKAIDTTGKEGAEALNTAIGALETQLAEFTTNPNIMQLGLAVRNLVIAMRAFEEANLVYTVVGGLNTTEGGQADAIFGTSWEPTLTDNDMVKGADGIWTKTYENIALEPGFIYYKVVKNHSWDNAYGFGGENANYEIKSAGTAETITFTFDPATESVSCAVKMADSDLMAEARELAAEDGVAVGKLLQAIAYAEAGDESGLQAAIDQYKLDNADQEKDETAKVATNGWKKFDGSDAGVCATQFAPAITTYDGRTAQMAECYETNGNRTGTIIYQDITGLTNGKYKVGFYGNAFSTSQRDGFECTMEDGATDVAYVFANEEKEYISARIATSTTENDFRQFDVEVTDGNIKLGMGKDTEKSTNWHTIQIYQLTWFTTAKEVFAQDQEELKAVIAEAKALLADETKTEGKEALEFFVIGAEQAVDSKMYNIAEVEAVIGNLKDMIAGFKKANWYIDLTAGDYYIIDVESGLKMAAGHDWGTRGIVNEMGLDLTLTPYTESRTVTIDSRVYNGDTSHFLGSNLYMDSSEWGWALEYQGFGFYILEPNGGKYINLDKDNNLVLSDTPREFIIVTKDGVMAQRMAELEIATKDAPVDATFLIKANNFNRGDARNAEAWQWTPSETAEENPDNWNNHNFSGGNQVNNCAESYHAAFNVMQTISGAPAGIYQLTAQGFYRQDNYEGELPAAPQFFANEVNADVPAKAGSENSMSDASASFTNGLYTIEPINFEVKEDGMMYIGITASTNTQWVIWDNFQLTYFGEKSEEFEPIIPDGTYYVMSANEGTVINAESALDIKGSPITFTFDKTANTYTIEGADIFAGKQWTIADAVEGMSGYYTISTPEGFLAANATALEQIADGTADAAVWILLEKAYWEDIVNSTYTVAGTKNLTDTGNDWDIDEANQMTYNDETQLYEKKFKRIAIDAENQPEFKVVQTNMAGENIWYPENNWVITTDYVGGEGLYDITITFDPSDFKEIGVIAEKRIVFPENAIVYDFEAAADAGENPANKNGSAANGQAFFGWENPEKTDSKRQDYKGYEWAEGSLLPEVCHVWRRSDRINGNVADNGGLKCPSNKEMAIDGLNEGDKVIIVYDAENATDKEIIWAIGDGTSDGGPGVVRATATINGVEAVTGETTIASGAEIVINSVTPAENGSGYIVFQVKKGMVIQQIAVIPAPEEVASPYYLVGTMTNWADEGVKEDYNLTLNTEAGEGVEEYMITLNLTTTDQFKIVKKDGETLTWYPSEGNNYGENGEITENGEYTVYFRPNADGGADWFYGVIYVASTITDGISTVNIDTQDAVVYNIKGQKVTKARKGLYIVNGKKVVLK